MNKKIIGLVVVGLVLAVAGAGIWWWENRETPIEKWEAAKTSQEEDYTVKETPEGKIVENKKVGLTYEIPKDWILENENPTRFYSSDTKFKEKSSVFLEKGCKIDVYASYVKTNLDTLKKFIDAEFSKSSYSITKLDEFSIIKVSNYSALRHKYHVEKFGMSSVLVDFPSKNKLYRILLSMPIGGSVFIGENEHCEKEFNKFLETVSVQ